MIHCKEEKCDFCGCCVAVCPADAIELRQSSIEIDQTLCSSCLFCIAVCPFGILEVFE